MTLTKKFNSFALAALLATTALTGCGQKQASEQKPVNTVAPAAVPACKKPVHHRLAHHHKAVTSAPVIIANAPPPPSVYQAPPVVVYQQPYYPPVYQAPPVYIYGGRMGQHDFNSLAGGGGREFHEAPRYNRGFERPRMTEPHSMHYNYGHR